MPRLPTAYRHYNKYTIADGKDFSAGYTDFREGEAAWDAAPPPYPGVRNGAKDGKDDGSSKSPRGVIDYSGKFALEKEKHKLAHTLSILRKKVELYPSYCLNLLPKTRL